MSGPKGGCYSITDEAHRRARELAAARAAFVRWQAQVDQLERRVDEAITADDGLSRDMLPPRPVDTADERDTSDLRRATEDLRRYHDLLRESFEEHQAAVRTARVLAAIRGNATDGAHARSAADVLAERAARPTGEDEPTEGAPAVTDTVARILDRIRVDVPTAARQELESLARSALEANVATAESLVLELRQRALEANASASRLAEDQAAATEMLASLDAADAQRPDLVARLEAVVSGHEQLEAELRQDVRDVVERANAESDREFVAVQLEEVLADLGYEIEPGFDTVLVRDGVAHFQRPEWREYAVRLRLPSGSRRLALHLVRSAGEGTVDERRRDVEMEQRWCEEVPALLEACAADGVEVDLDRRAEPGAQSVLQVQDLEVGEAARRGDRRRRRPLERRHP